MSAISLARNSPSDVSCLSPRSNAPACPTFEHALLTGEIERLTQLGIDVIVPSDAARPNRQTIAPSPLLHRAARTAPPSASQ